MNAPEGNRPTGVARVSGAIADIDAGAWDACANPDPATYNPFIAHAFLKALEDAGTVGEKRTGWLPQHITIADHSGDVVACMPCYAKLNSSGEYVFDWSWADAYERAGGRYYPKMQAAVPFTPVPGRRLLTKPGPDSKTHQRLLAAAAAEVTQRIGASSLHVTFLPEDEWETLGNEGFLKRTDQQFHWRNEGYANFDEFLATFASRKRKAVKKERSEALRYGLTIEWITGADLTEAHWDAFYAFYMDTGARKWGHPYLNRRFFSLLGETMADRCLLIMVKRGPHYIAGALNLIGGDCLYGRYWGALEQYPCLHFEVCYYQAIDYAIEKGLKRVEAGAQGEHKLARGYLPTTTYSAHWIRDPALRKAIARYLEDERRAVAATGAALAEFAPYRKGGPET
jgi:predicted N-acyltransferase